MDIRRLMDVRWLRWPAAVLLLLLTPVLMLALRAARGLALLAMAYMAVMWAIAVTTFWDRYDEGPF